MAMSSPLSSGSLSLSRVRFCPRLSGEPLTSFMAWSTALGGLACVAVVLVPARGALNMLCCSSVCSAAAAPFAGRARLPSILLMK